MKRVKILAIVPIMIFIAIFMLFSPYTAYTFPPNRALQDQYWQTQSEELQQHIKQWQDQKITKYRLGLKLGTYFEQCDREVIIDQGGIIEQINIQTIRGICGTYNLMTIGRLFLQMNKMLAEKNCGRDGCTCSGPYHMDAVYDEKYRFPKSAKPAYHSEENWRYAKTNIFGAPNLLNVRGNPVPFVETFCLGYGDLDINFAWDVYSFIPLK